ncbi:hypothetical protein C4577_02535 [Candidatus Parcubacteria bacterium]|nr:MAG: hypothetical protein C4577_02535 [Candidatus Parcubacteria bacterium]
MNKGDNKRERIDPKVKDVLKLLAVGTVMATVLLFPGIAGVSYFLKKEEQEKWKNDKKEWEKYNLGRLRQLLKRLQQQKVIEIKNGIVNITEKGSKRLLKYDLDEIKLKEKRDGKWRLIIYDISNLRKPQREMFRQTLKKLKLLKLQESVYITPFICDEEIEYLRNMFGIDKEVMILKIFKIENEEAYKKYFGL